MWMGDGIDGAQQQKVESAVVIDMYWGFIKPMAHILNRVSDLGRPSLA